MSDTFKYEPVVCIRVEGGDVYHVRGLPTDPRKLINKINETGEYFKEARYMEAYDARGNLHLVNTNYIIDIYIDEKAYLKKEETK